MAELFEDDLQAFLGLESLSAVNTLLDFKWEMPSSIPNCTKGSQEETHLQWHTV